MALLDRDVMPASISIKGVLYTVFLLLLILSLFFIPEIVRFKQSISGSKRTQSSSSSSSRNVVQLEDIMAGEPIPVDPEDDGESGSLDKVMDMLSPSGIRDSLYNGRENRRKGKELSNKEIGTTLKDIQANVSDEKYLKIDDVTWERLNSQPVRRAFRDAQTQAQEILKNLPAKQNSVRFALINYINGLGWITRSDRKLMTADEALAYIEQLDINVTQAMLTSEVSAEDFNQWKKVSLGPLSLNSRASAFKLNRAVAFNPRLTLAEVQVRKSPDYRYRSNGTVERLRSRSSIEVGGFVLGKDTKSVAVYRNGRRIAFIRPSKRGNADGLRRFKVKYRAADGVFTFRVFSADGEAFEKHYVFLAKVNGRFPQDEKGFYNVPFNVADFDQLAVRNIDTRLDRFFRVSGRPGGGREGAAFDTF